jgi:ribonuclease R
MALKFKSRLLAHVAHESYSPAPIDTLAADLGVPDVELEEFKAAVDQLVREKTLIADSRERILLPTAAARGEITGTFKKNQRGFGFVIPDVKLREGDIFVPREETGDALTGDHVRVEVVQRMRRGEEEVVGRIIEVIRRKRKSFSGELARQGQLWVVYPDGREMTTPIVVADATSKNAKPGDKVVVEITRYSEGDDLPEGVIVRVLGEAGLPDVETQAVIAAYNLPGEFPDECIEQARRAASLFDAEVARAQRDGQWPGRLDLTDDFILTIDPPDAKDYDDAISLKRIQIDGPAGKELGWELGVHIADVATFIEPGSPLDKEARERGNSVYLPRLVIPMLPEVLSNGICSLQEGVIRFCKSSFMIYDREGRVRKEWVGATVIKSAKRTTYLEAQALIDGDLKEAVKHAKTDPKYTDQLIASLRDMDTLSRAIRDRRRKAGMIHLDLPSVNLVFDEMGHVIDAEPEDNAYTHTLIEMFMVEANEVLARLFENLKVPLLRRVHPDPVPGDVGELQTAARVAGYKIPKAPTREELQSLLDATRGTGAARAVHMAVLRTLAKAEYSPALIGHFALASGAYAHFTSPIRRYADLLVHRALAEYLRHTDNGTRRPTDKAERNALGEKLRSSPMCPDEETLVQIGRHISTTEVNAEDAENNLRSFLVLQLLHEHIGESFPGIVTGVTASGVFVQLEKYLADGMIKAADLPTGGKPGHEHSSGGGWRIDSRTGGLVHQSGRSFNIGDKISATIANIDLALRKMDLVVTDAQSRAAGKSKKAPPTRAEQALGGGGLNLDWDTLKYGKSGADRRAQRSKSREKGKSDFRQDRKDKGKR